jgi:heme oxygenase
MDKHEAAQLGRIGGLTTISRHGAEKVAARARAGGWRRFLEQVDPDGTLPEAEREQRAQAAQRAHMARIARLSVQARKKRASGGDAA